jgi:hypothetical protein
MIPFQATVCKTSRSRFDVSAGNCVVKRSLATWPCEQPTLPAGNGCWHHVPAFGDWCYCERVGSFRESQDCRVRYSAQQCRDRARECEWMSSQAKDSEARDLFIELARQWQELALQKEDLEKNWP